MVPAFFGVFNIYYDGRHFLKSYKDHGYIAGQTMTFCSREVFELEAGAIEHMKWGSYDHEMVSLFCDGNFTPMNGSTYPILSGNNSIRKRCLYGKSVLSYSLDYANQFFEKYKDQPKFFKLGLAEGHEGTAEVIKYSDDELLNFIENFEKKGFLDDTIVYIQSDHGLGMPGPYGAFELDDFTHESVLPAFFMVMPKSTINYQDIRANLIHNENSIISPFNIYNSLKAILNDKKYLKFSMINDQEFFNYAISRDDDCMKAFYYEEYHEDWDYHCRCNK